jgi:hypothetical protein
MTPTEIENSIVVGILEGERQRRGLPEFESFRKIPRLFRDITVMEKVDGSNGQIYIPTTPVTADSGKEYRILAGSRNRWVFPKNDNYGFAKWVYENEESLLRLGPGHHFGEWFGAGIQRRYGLTEKRFALFNVARWGHVHSWEEKGNLPEGLPPNVGIVPVLYTGEYNMVAVGVAINALRFNGSSIVPGFMDPEGIVLHHSRSGQLYKFTLDGDAMKGNS